MLLTSLLLMYVVSVWATRKRIKRRRGVEEPPDFDVDVGGGYSEFMGEEGVTFVPPMQYQRIAAVTTLLKDPRWNGKIRKLCDLGCGEFALSVVLQELPLAEEYCALDYMEAQLREKLITLSVLGDVLRSKGQRILLRVFAGSLDQPDDRLARSDAVICIEVIEHLYPDVLESVPHAVFGCLRPRVAIFSTPNSEFNFLFGDARRFRDSDHKFEWTREQFKCWAGNIVLRYPEYGVEFYGVGRGPPGTTHAGCCTQLALFHRVNDDDDDVEDAGQYGQPYVHVHDFNVEPPPTPPPQDSLYTGLVGDESSSDSWRLGSDEEFDRQPTEGPDDGAWRGGEGEEEDGTSAAAAAAVVENWWTWQMHDEDWDEEDYGDSWETVPVTGDK